MLRWRLDLLPQRVGRVHCMGMHGNGRVTKWEFKVLRVWAEHSIWARKPLRNWPLFSFRNSCGMSL